MASNGRMMGERGGSNSARASISKGDGRTSAAALLGQPGLYQRLYLAQFDAANRAEPSLAD